MAISEGATAPAGGERFSTGGIVDDPGDNLAIHFDPDRYRVGGEAVEKVRRPIERVDHPAHARCAVAVGALFAEDAVTRPGNEDAFDDQRFRSPVDFSDHIGRARLRFDRFAHECGPAGDELAGFQRNVGGEVQQHGWIDASMGHRESVRHRGEGLATNAQSPQQFA